MGIVYWKLYSTQSHTTVACQDLINDFRNWSADYSNLWDCNILATTEHFRNTDTKTLT